MFTSGHLTQILSSSFLSSIIYPLSNSGLSQQQKKKVRDSLFRYV